VVALGYLEVVLKLSHESTLLLLALLAACTGPSPDETVTTMNVAETDDETSTSTSDSESTTETDTAETSESETETETETETGEPEPDPVCGNGAVEGPELCDDGNLVDDDGCSNACDPRTCAVTWSRVSEESTLTSSYVDNAPIAELPNGNIVIGNTIDGETSIDVRVQVWTPDGDLVWEVVHVLGPLRDGLGDVLADPSGDIFVGGAANVGTDGIAKVLRLSGADGSILWTYENDAALRLERTTVLAFDDQNRVLAGLEAGAKSGETNVEVYALDPMTGIPVWDGKWGSEGERDDWPTGIAFDETTGRIWVLANTFTNGPEDEITATLLAFEPPSEIAALAVVPFDDRIPDADESGSLVFDAEGRLWVSVDDTVGEDQEYAEIDPADGSVVRLLDSRDMAIDGDVHQSWAQGEVDALAGGGLALVGWIPSNEELGLEQYGYVVALDAEGQHDCIARVTDDTSALFFPFQAFGASNGAIFANGHAAISGDWHAMLLRVR
jgi:cysteine-rich repeat protein